jgi:carbamoyltransferase
LSKNLPSLNFYSAFLKRSKIKKNEFNKLLDLISKYSKNNLYKVDHHLAHLNSSFLISNFDECVNVSVDGFGDFKSSSYGISKGNFTKVDGSVFFPHSLGIFYQSLTQFVGFKNYGDEYKLMGLSAYGNNTYVDRIENLLYSKKMSYQLNLDYFRHHKKNIQFLNENDEIYYDDIFNIKLEELLGHKSSKKFEYNQSIADIAKSTQTVYEKILFNYLNNFYDFYQNPNLCLSGGCALNSLANGKIIKNTKFKNLFIPYEPSDAGGSIGAALTCYYEKNFQKKKIPQPTPYLGTNFSNIEIKETLNNHEDNNKFTYKEFEDANELIDITAQYIADGKIIAWFQDKMEFGPRALGNRSILMDPSVKNAKEVLNLKIKLREKFRPFAPSILEEETEKWFESYTMSDYMTFVYKIKQDKRSFIPAVCHVDGTGRLQTVKKNLNDRYYKLILSFFKKKKIPMVLNTSFNENEPIVNTPKEALNTFLRTKIDILVIDDFIIQRSD